MFFLAPQHQVVPCEKWPDRAVHAHQPSGARPCQPESFLYGRPASHNCTRGLCFLACTRLQGLAGSGARVHLCYRAICRCLPLWLCLLFPPQIVDLKAKKWIIIRMTRVHKADKTKENFQDKKGLVMGLKMLDDVPSGGQLGISTDGFTKLHFMSCC